MLFWRFQITYKTWVDYIIIKESIKSKFPYKYLNSTKLSTRFLVLNRMNTVFQFMVMVGILLFVVWRNKCPTDLWYIPPLQDYLTWGLCWWVNFENIVHNVHATFTTIIYCQAYLTQRCWFADSMLLYTQPTHSVFCKTTLCEL